MPSPINSEQHNHQAGSPIFIHSSWRASHTWFWLKYREHSSAICFYEPFHEVLATITRSWAESLGPDAWDSRHPAAAPYLLEYVPLIRRAGGVRLFVPEISYRWFLPSAGLLGNLDPKEVRYLALLIRHAERLGRVPVFGFARSLGRIAAIKKQFSGIHIFQHRNLWTQWMSWIEYKKNENTYFFRQLLRVMVEVNDPYLSTILAHHMSRCFNAPSDDCERMRRANDHDCETLISQIMLQSDDQQLFVLYMGFHTYFYMFARTNVDMIVDTTKAAKDEFYGKWICRQLASATGLPIGLDDVSEFQRYHPFEPALIDWEEIKQNLDSAILVLGQSFDKHELSWYGTELLNETLAEIEMSERYLASARREITRLKSERDALRDERDRLSVATTSR